MSAKERSNKKFLHNKDLNLVFSVSMTTREKRINEIEGQDYFFVSKEIFEKAIKNHEFLEWAEFFNNYYGTPISYVEKLLNENKNVLLEIEVIGAEQVLKHYVGSKDIISIFLVPPNIEILEERIVNRGTENSEKIKKRIAKAKVEMKIADKYQYTVVNNVVSEAANKIIKIIKDNIS